MGGELNGACLCDAPLVHSAGPGWPGSLQPGQSMFLTLRRGSEAHPAPSVFPGVTVSRAGLNPLLLFLIDLPISNS